MRQTITAGATEDFGKLSFTLGDLNSATDFSLFRLYRIDRVVVEFVPNQSQFTADATVAKTVPFLYTSVISSPGKESFGEADIIHRNNVKRHSCTAPFKVSITPKVALAAATTAATALPDIPKAHQWLETISPTIAHWGLDYVYTPAVGCKVSWQVHTTYELSFKEVQ